MYKGAQAATPVLLYERGGGARTTWYEEDAHDEDENFGDNFFVAALLRSIIFNRDPLVRRDQDEVYIWCVAPAYALLANSNEATKKHIMLGEWLVRRI